MTDTLRLPCRLAPSIGFYRALARHNGPVEICCAERFDKRVKAAHRFVIADTRGPLELTIPIAKPYGRTWADTRLSDHGRWWETIPAALESAYGRTPYFEFYAPDLLPLLANPAQFASVGELNAAVNRFMLRALALNDRDVSYSFTPGARPDAVPDFEPQPYWQLRADSLGFIGGLSAFDPLFNLGPEAQLLL